MRPPTSSFRNRVRNGYVLSAIIPRPLSTWRWTSKPCALLLTRATLTAHRYVKDILTNTPRSTEQVTIEPDGNWLLPALPQSEEQTRPQPEASFIEDDDLVVGQVSSRQSNTATPNRPGYVFGTPAQGSSREGSSIAAPRSSSKRAAAEVIDLTLSDDDDADVRPVKRPNTNAQFNGYSNGWGSAG